MNVLRYFPSRLFHRTDGEFDGTLHDIPAVNRWLASHGVGPMSESLHASGDRPRQVYEIRPDLRAAFPHALLPPGRRAFFDWLLTHGKTEYGLSNDEILAALIELDHDPTHGLEDTYRLTPRWQRAVPNGLSLSGWPQLLRRLRSEEGLTGRWLDDGIRPDVSLRTDGLNLIGHFRLPCGVGEEIVRFAEGLEQIGVPVTRRDVPAYRLTEPLPSPRPLGLEDHAVSLLKFGAAVDLRAAYERAGLYPQPGVYRVAGWSWELDTFPEESRNQLDFVDEIWTPSRFVAEGAGKMAAGRPVRVMTPAVPTPVAPEHPRARFELDPDAYVILFAFDAGSVIERKNPFALVQAVRDAFRRDDRVVLVLKVSNGAAAPDAMARLRTELHKIGGRLVEETFSRTDTDALLVSCDCYASLHRAEGFGLTLAEAMRLGKPTVATGYSGNLDFMTPGNSFLVTHRLVELEREVGPYPAGAVWAEPDLGHAAERLRYVYDHPDEARAVGVRAKRDCELLLDPASAARRIAGRLREIHATTGKAAA